MQGPKLAIQRIKLVDSCLLKSVVYMLTTKYSAVLQGSRILIDSSTITGQSHPHCISELATL
jgi:hypothetical protein